MAHRAAVATSLAVLSLVLHLTLASEFRRHDAFEQLNVLFHADITTRLLAFSGGLHLGIKHPNLMPYFTPPIALAAKMLIALHPASGSELEVRRRLGTLVVPVASAGTTALVFYLFHYLGYSMLQAVIATLLALVSFSSLVFGSIPESYGLTALALAGAYAFAAGSGSALTWRRSALWVAIGVFATGITLTNLVFVVLLVWSSVWNNGRDFRMATLQAAAIGIVILGVTGFSAYVFDALLVQPKSSAVGDANDLTVAQRVAKPFRWEIDAFHLSRDPVRKLHRFPTSVANTIAPPAVEREPIKDIGRHRLGFTLEQSPSIFGLGDPLGLAIVVLVIAGATYGLATPSTGPIAIASIGIVAFSWLISVWGGETYLYSQHWHLAAVVLIAGVMRARTRGQLTTALLGVLTLVVAVNNFLLLRAMLAALAAAPP